VLAIIIVSQSPDLIVYTKDEDDHIIQEGSAPHRLARHRPRSRVHAVVFGPDGRYYLNNGDPDSTSPTAPATASSAINPSLLAGCALRVNPDGTGFTVLGQNFRNPYELALDSFGSVWQTDNDDAARLGSRQLRHARR